MIKVLLVDDEMIFRLGLKSCINWNELGFELIGEAENGQKALEFIKISKPDIIFTDIKMPVMDGLELTRNIIGKYNDITIIIVSCYNDFEYVKEALKLGAHDYILKLSMKPSSLTKLLKELKNKVEEENKLKHKEKMLTNEFIENIDNLKANYLKNIINSQNNISKEELKKKSIVLDLKLSFDNNIVMILKVDDYYRAIEKSKDERLFNTTFLNLVREVLRNNLKAEFFEYDAGVYVCIFNFNGKEKSDYLHVVIEKIKEINATSKQLLNITVSAGVCNQTGSINELTEIFNRAYNALTISFYESNEYIGIYKEEAKYSSVPYKIDISYENAIQNAMEISNAEEVNRIINQIIGDIRKSKNILPNNVKSFFKEILYIFNRAAKRFGGEITSLGKVNPFYVLDKLNSLYDIQEWLGKLVIDISDYIIYLKNLRYRSEVTRVIDTLIANMDTSISLKEAAGIANMSEKYFCSIFKKETGKTFIEYSTEIKMNRAKELLKDRDLKMYEIALKLGIESESYFSKLFKKATGVSPQEYRQEYYI